MNLQERITSFKKLGEILQQFTSTRNAPLKKSLQTFLEKKVHEATLQNPWFTQTDIHSAFHGLSKMLETDKLNTWINQYPELKKQIITPRKVGVVNAGNIPLVGFHDFLATLLTGNYYIGKLSSKDNILLPAIRDILTDISPEFKDYIHFEEHLLKDFDAIIATGSDNSARYFHYYFGKYPHIIRKNRNGVAVLPPDYSMEELKRLANDIFLYYGLGCRNVSKIFFPEDFIFKHFFDQIEHYGNQLINHNKYANNYEYHKSIFLMNQEPHLDNGFVLLKPDTAFSSPISTLFYETYQNRKEVEQRLETQTDQIQCVVSRPGFIGRSIPFGKAQFPELWDYADNVDTIEFLLSLHKQ